MPFHLLKTNMNLPPVSLHLLAFHHHVGVRFKPDSCLPAGGAPDTARECSFFVRKLDQSFISMISKYLVTFRSVFSNSDIE